ncbi:MAG: hypothetical protein ACYTF6_14445, partial [Planctomycetota bacterium]
MSSIADKYNLEVAEKYLIPRTFYFVVEQTEPWHTASGGPSDSYHVEVALYRLNEEAKDFDEKDENGEPSWCRVLRSWNEEESKAFRYSPGYWDPVAFWDFPDNIREFPYEGGLGWDCLPALVIVTERLEPDREYAAFARIHDGLQWGPWSRIAQVRLDFVAAEGFDSERSVATADKLRNALPLQDLPHGGSKPKIEATLNAGHESIARPASKKADEQWKALTIKGKVTVTDEAPLKSIFCNGEMIWPSGGGSFSSKKIFRVENLDFGPVAITEGCPRIEITAENELGFRSQAVKVFLPKYGSEGKVLSYDAVENCVPTYDDSGKVTGFRMDKRRFFDEEVHEQLGTFRLRFCGVPYRLPVGATKKEIKASLLVGNSTEAKEITLHPIKRAGGTLSKAAHRPFLGRAQDKWPKALQPRDTEPYTGEVIVSVEFAYSGDEVVLETRKKNVEEEAASAIWYSGPLVLLDSSGDMGCDSIVEAQLGDLLQGYIPVRNGGEPSSGWPFDSQNTVPGTLAQDKDFDVTVSPKAAAAGVVPVAYASQTILPGLKNGDLMRVAAYTMAGETMPRIEPKPKTAYVFTKDVIKRGQPAGDAPPYPLVEDHPEQRLKLSSRGPE